MSTIAKPSAPSRTARLSDEDALDIAVEAYTYAYPLVIMELTRRTRVNVSGPTPDGRAPMNQFGHMPAFPDASFTDIVRPNADTLYSIMWFDVSTEPLVIGVPAASDRYYLMPMLDLWTDVFASPGPRTTGPGAQRFTLVGPAWDHAIAPGTQLIRSPTPVGWILGRTQTNGRADYPAVHEFQTGFTAAPLSQADGPHTPAQSPVNTGWDTKTPPIDQIAQLDAEAFFALFAQLTRMNPPHAHDYPILHRMRRIGLEPGKTFAMSEAPLQVRHAMDRAPALARKAIDGAMQRAGAVRNGWHMQLSEVGEYGVNYLQRAQIAMHGIGANTVEDAVYPGAFTDADGKPLSSDARYVIHFAKAALPPVRAFWSLTLYNERQFFAANKMDRYAIGDRDPLRFNEDGSLDLSISRDSPGEGRESNWLPAPEKGNFTLVLRLYWPKREALDGTWTPPAVTRVG